jgi:plasmid maintenance system antidote protein VapI
MRADEGLTRYFGLSEGFFLRLQTNHDLLVRRRQIGKKLKAIKPRAAQTSAIMMEDKATAQRINHKLLWRCSLSD